MYRIKILSMFLMNKVSFKFKFLILAFTLIIFVTRMLTLLLALINKLLTYANGVIVEFV